MTYKPVAEARMDRYLVPIATYTEYYSRGFTVVRGLVPTKQVEEVASHAMDILYGRHPVEGLQPPPAGATPEELTHRFTRVHMLHRVDEVAERTMLHPRILDVLEALGGPDVLALQTMLFFNPPGLGGQGWHQDSYYITTYPDTLIGAWLALDRADEDNGCVWVAPGSHAEPVHPDVDRGSLMHAESVFQDLSVAVNASNMDDSVNSLAKVAAEYPDAVPAVMEPGDVLFFHGHILHRSYPNRTQDRWRRAFVSHYCNARSWVPWNHGASFEGDSANSEHILARGQTHLPHAEPCFGSGGAGHGSSKASASAPDFAWNRSG